MRDGFLTKSNRSSRGAEEFGAVESSHFTLPLLTASGVFGLPEQELKAYFELFDVYLRESPSDAGMLLASEARP